MSEKKIIKFDPIRLPIKTTHEKSYCKHNKILLDQGYRVVKCESCNEIIDPFNYLLEWANGDRNLNTMRTRLKQDIKRHSDRLESLKREERNIKNRINRAKHREDKREENA